jgi:hypothetical protein
VRPIQVIDAMTIGRTPLRRFAIGACIAATSGCGASHKNGGGESATAASPLLTVREQNTASDDLARYVSCMQKHGVHAEVLPGSRRGVRLSNPDSSRPDLSQSAIQAADRACHALLKPTQTEPSNRQEAEFRDKALAFAKCLRRHGIQVGDPVIKRVAGGFDLTLPPPPGQSSADLSAAWQQASAACSSSNPFLN